MAVDDCEGLDSVEQAGANSPEGEHRDEAITTARVSHE